MCRYREKDCEPEVSPLEANEKCLEQTLPSQPSEYTNLQQADFELLVSITVRP